MKIKLFRIDEDIKENKFQEYISNLGYKCKKLKISNADSIRNILGLNFKEGTGMPDFLIYNDKEKFLCEFKSAGDSWQIHQIKWILDNLDIPFALAFVDIHREKNKPQSLSGEIELNTEMEEQFRIINISWDIKKYILNEYALINPKIVNKTMFYDNIRDCYMGGVPSEVSKKWYEFDEIFFKDKQKQESIIKIYKENRFNLRAVFNFINKEQHQRNI